MTSSLPGWLRRILATGVMAGLVVLLMLSRTAAAQSPIPSPDIGETTDVARIESAIEAASSDTTLDEATRTQVVDALRSAQASIRDRIAAEDSAIAFAGVLKSAPAQTEKILQSLEQVETPIPTAAMVGARDDMTLTEVEQLLAAETSNLAAAEARLTDIERQLDIQQGRPNAIRARINEIREQLSAPAPQPSAGQNPAIADARRLADQLRRQARDAELQALNQELLSNSARVELLKAQRRVARDSLGGLLRRVEFVQSLVNDRRQATVAAAQRSALQAELAASDKHPAIRELAEGNAALSAELANTAVRIERATASKARIEEYARSIEEKFTRSRQRFEIGGVNQAIGQLFLEERRNLPKVSQYRTEVRARSRTLADIGLAQVRVEEELAELTPLDDRIDDLMTEISADVSDPGVLPELRPQVELLLQDRRDLLNQSMSVYTSYLHALSDLDIAQRRLLETAGEYQAFLDQNLMWIPSSGFVRAGNIARLFDALNWILSPQNWKEAAVASVDAFREYWVASLFAALVLLAVLVFRRMLRPRFAVLSSRIGRLSTDHIGLTLGALGITVLQVLPLPLLLALFGVALQNTPASTEFTTAVGQSLLLVAPFLANTLWFRALFSGAGVARIHFGWPEDTLRVIRHQLDRLMAVGAPLFFAAALLYTGPVPAHRDSLGRLAFIALMVVFSSVIHPIAHPAKGVIAGYYREHAARWSARLRWLWYALAAGGPLLLAVGTAVGYTYAAAILTGRLIDTFWLLLGLTLVNLVVLRWLALERRKIAWQRALQKREERRAEAAAEGDTPADSDAPVAESAPLDLDAVDQQTRRLLRAGLFLVGILAAWGIWSDVLPALSILDRVSLWSQTVTVDGAETVAPVTLADLLLALVIIGVTAVASRNLPGLMEIAVLQRLTLQPGSRYAVNTLVRYVVLTIGIVAVLQIIGWKWSQIQWLVAALGVGLGFGLQEIVANFVAGLIILFERPVRVGDTVTVGQLTGTVSKLRIRATTITDWDRKEILVPNKAFITEQVVNWTLTDPITRLVIPVGISYGSDVQLAHRVMEETLKGLPLVLDDPPPRVYFTGFGESSLDFKMYVYSRELTDRLPLTHAVHQEILGALRRHAIEIPFPQRELHLRTVDDAAGRNLSGRAEPGSDES